MEKIKAALAKVKSTKKVEKKTQQSTAEPSIKIAVDTKENQDIGEINYTTSTVVNFDLNHVENNRIVSHLTNNVNASIFDSLRTQVLQKMEENNWQSIAIISPTADSGKTLVSVNLSISIAKQPKKTALLVDFDLRKPKVSSYLGLEVQTSMNEYLANKASIEDVLVNPSIQHLVVAPTLSPVSEAAEVLSSTKVAELIVELKERYDSRIVIYDLPPILSVDDAMIVIPQVDCVLMVVANGASTPTQIEDALHLIPKDKLVGIVYNKAEEENKAYYY